MESVAASLSYVFNSFLGALARQSALASQFQRSTGSTGSASVFDVVICNGAVTLLCAAKFCERARSDESEFIRG